MSRSGESVDSGIRQASVDSGRAMASSAKGAGGDTEDNELYKLNQVYYRSIPSLSTVTKRSVVRTNFQKTGYTGLSSQTIQCVINTGELFINGCQSFLVTQFGIDLSSLPATDLNYRAAANEPKTFDMHAFLGPGGFASIIDEVWLTSASGTEICREQNKGLQIAHYLHNTLQPEYVRRNGIVEGLPSPNVSDTFSGRGYCRDEGAVATADVSAGPVYNRRGAYYSGGATNAANGALAIQRPSILNDQGLCEVTYFSTTTQSYSASTAPYFAIPMSHLLGCFNPYMKVLFPGIALAGATLSIRIKNLVEPLIMTGAGFGHGGADAALATTRATNVANLAQINQIYINWDTYQMNDAVIKKVNEISAGTNGLTVMFDTFDWTVTQAAGTQVEAQVSQARSRIKMSFCVVRAGRSLTNPFIPSLCSEAGTLRKIGPNTAGTPDQQISDLWSTTKVPTVVRYQAVLGSLYFPQQPLETLAEYYANQLYIFGKDYRDDTDVSCVSIEDLGGAQGNLVWAAGNPTAPSSDPSWCFPYGMGVYGMTGERSSLLQLTGLTISNARLLRHQFTFDDDALPSTGNRQIDTFTQFTRQAKVFLGGRVVVRE